MKKIAIITDVHGNDQALIKALEIIKKEKCDEIISLGDLIGIGPNGNQVLNIVRVLPNFHTVLGNHEKYFLYGFDNPLSCTDINHQNWIKSQISDINAAYIKKLNFEYTFTYNNKKIGFLHYAKRKGEKIKFAYIVKNPSIGDLTELYKNYDYDIIFYGHEHKPSNIKGEKWFINPGSLGCAVSTEGSGMFGILELDEKITYREINFNYDDSKVITDMYSKNMPGHEFISKAFYKHQ